MAKLPKTAEQRIITGLRRFQPILVSAKGRDVNESDTAVIVRDLVQKKNSAMTNKANSLLNTRFAESFAIGSLSLRELLHF